MIYLSSVNVFARICPKTNAIKIPTSPYFKICLKACCVRRNNKNFNNPANIIVSKISLAVIIVMSISLSPNVCSFNVQ